MCIRDSTYTHDLLGEKVCTGAKRGLKSRLPKDRECDAKLRMVEVSLNSGGYAPNGAYFGRTRDSRLFHVASVEEFALDYDQSGTIRMFVRAADRAAAKTAVRSALPNARFYR
jgi:hypothetical protein